MSIDQDRRLVPTNSPEEPNTLGRRLGTGELHTGGQVSDHTLPVLPQQPNQLFLRPNQPINTSGLGVLVGGDGLLFLNRRRD